MDWSALLGGAVGAAVGSIFAAWTALTIEKRRSTSATQLATLQTSITELSTKRIEQVKTELLKANSESLELLKAELTAELSEHQVRFSARHSKIVDFVENLNRDAAILGQRVEVLLKMSFEDTEDDPEGEQLVQEILPVQEIAFSLLETITTNMIWIDQEDISYLTKRLHQIIVVLSDRLQNILDSAKPTGNGMYRIDLALVQPTHEKRKILLKAKFEIIERCRTLLNHKKT
ncbi:MAG: hypothetical protein KDD67_11535 [Ignavibacteriae bacterium]|nr:hypothetical protein [Ignavibacteriota bacterium]MCB9216575.1 hypothetical protein [Ignavibacteria bacterium]